jgi:DNA-directed RNA polymerase specialized sigma24 family protein
MEVKSMAATYDDLAEDIDRVARNVASDYPDIDWQDLRQELALFVLERGKSIKLRDQGGNPKRLLVLVANDYCKKLRTQHMSLSPQYAYRPTDIVQILDTAFFDSPDNGYVPDDARSPLSKTFNIYDPNGYFRAESIDPFHENDFLDVASDVKAAIKKLKPELREALYDRFVLQKHPDNNSYERKRLNKAVNELTLKLNWYRGNVTDRRKAISNAGAKAAISESYEG